MSFHARCRIGKQKKRVQTPRGKYEQETEGQGYSQFNHPDHYILRPLFSHPCSMRLGNDYSVGIYARGLVIDLQNKGGKTSSGSQTCKGSLTVAQS